MGVLSEWGGAGRRCKISCHKTRLSGIDQSGLLFQQSYHKDHTHQASTRNPQYEARTFRHDSCHNQRHDDQEDTDLDESKKEVVQRIHGNLPSVHIFEFVSDVAPTVYLMSYQKRC